MRQIVITVGDRTFKARLNDSPTANLIWNVLPIDGAANVWGDEVYFEIPVNADQEPGAREEVEIGELGYWPVGKAFCIFYGPTPVSTGDQPRAYSPVNIVGQMLGDTTQLRGTRSGAPVRIIRDIVG
ncbi:MAG: hypothetical protein JXJ17_05035 [Anaerolineae bacterium]|nr:hypothetical protein [Anaerolineae bacterium]